MSITDLYYNLFGRTGTNKGTDIDMAEHGRAGGVSTGQPFKYISDVEYALKITTSGTVTYIGTAKVGTLEATAAWQCKKIDSTTGVVITWADGNATFDNVATDLTALTYS